MFCMAFLHHCIQSTIFRHSLGLVKRKSAFEHHPAHAQSHQVIEGPDQSAQSDVFAWRRPLQNDGYKPKIMFYVAYDTDTHCNVQFCACKKNNNKKQNKKKKKKQKKKKKKKKKKRTKTRTYKSDLQLEK